MGGVPFGAGPPKKTLSTKSPLEKRTRKSASRWLKSANAHIFPIYGRGALRGRTSKKNAKYGKVLRKDDPEICVHLVEKCKCTYISYMKGGVPFGAGPPKFSKYKSP